MRVLRSAVAGFTTLMLLTTLLTEIGRAGEPCVSPVGRVVSIQGGVELQREPTRAWRAAILEEELCAGDLIHVADRGRAAIVLLGDGVIRIDQNTTLRLARVEADAPSLLEVIIGSVYFFSRRPRALDVTTPFVNAAVEGTEFLISAKADRSEVTVYEGKVTTSNERGQLSLTAGQSAVAMADEAPAGVILVQPRDAVQWAVYYPPILFAPPGGQPGRTDTWPAPLRDAAKAAANGDSAGAFDALARVPADERGAEYHNFAAALLLSVGRVDAAREEIARALGVNPDAGGAYALRAVIGVVENDVTAALEDAERAVQLEPRSAAAAIALSYALQANLELPAARNTLLRAVGDEPANALAWARLAELWLGLGDPRKAREAIDQAVMFGPDLERVQSVRGFVDLANFRYRAADKAFRRAVTLDSASPLARFGLGLTVIRTGDLARGRNDIEVATGLDPNRSLLRSYLGKAYFAERRETLAGEQYTIAKGALDARDPTPWFYDAILKQSENRPVEALDDLERSIALNDNRAVYRSRMLLDQDLASRQASIGRIYDDLGFQRLGFNEATKSLSLDPGNASAHRFLADVYAPQPRTDIARVSELLQAQLLQDININPVQPSLSETRLNIASGGGVARSGLNEFSPIFERNQVRLDLTGEVGSNQTYANEAVVSAIYDGLSISAGQFHYQTNGFRKNNDLEHNIYNIFAQAAISPTFNVQAEVRARRTESGDLDLNFDPDFFSPKLDRDLDQDTFRLGARYSPSPNSDVIASLIYTERNDKVSDAFEDAFFGFSSDENSLRQGGLQGETQWIYRRERFNAQAGFGAYTIDDRNKTTLAFEGFPADRGTVHGSTEQYTGYVYANINLPADITWTLGLGYDTYEDESANFDLFSPKLGVQWTVTESVRLRAAVVRSLKPALLANQTIQPTQVAGFNQFFDDVNGTKSWLYGVGLDARLSESVYGGIEATRRDLDEIVVPPPDRVVSENVHETAARAYLYWAAGRQWALTGEILYDLYDRNDSAFDRPNDVKTLALPLGVRYFSPTGIFAGAGVSFVHQDVSRRRDSELPEGSDNFYVVDAAIGYRFPHRRGLISLGVQNLLDHNFKYQDDNYRKAGNEPALSPFIPDRTIIGRVTLNF